MGFWTQWAKAFAVLKLLYEKSQTIDQLQISLKWEKQEFQESLSFLILEDSICLKGTLIELTPAQRQRCRDALEKLKFIQDKLSRIHL